MPIPGIGLIGIPVKCTHLAYAYVGLIRTIQTKLIAPYQLPRELKGNKETLPIAADRLPGVPSFE